MDDNNQANYQGPAKKAVKKSSKILKRFGATGLLVIVLFIAVVAAVFFYIKYQDSQDKLKHPEALTKVETQSLVEKVGRHVELPAGEQPTIATVSDVSKLANQTFFTGAQNGDKVLIYGKAKKAILYRP